MTQEEKRIKLAEAAGFTDIMLPMGFHQQMSDEKSKECGGRWRFEIPNYFEDLNAVHELENIIKDHPKWIKMLAKVIAGVPDATRAGGTKVFVDNSILARATAAERCEAIGKTLGLW
jgi:hypothetical protein